MHVRVHVRYGFEEFASKKFGEIYTTGKANECVSTVFVPVLGAEMTNR
jgi:hypothetical protein